MQLVINIDEEIYKRVLPYKDVPVISNLANDFPEITHAIANGVPLPKEHGRLIDADELYGDFIDGTEGYDCQTWNRSEIGDVIEYAPTIIEADRSEEE
jgi:hypothetical protein